MKVKKNPDPIAESAIGTITRHTTRIGDAPNVVATSESVLSKLDSTLDTLRVI